MRAKDYVKLFEGFEESSNLALDILDVAAEKVVPRLFAEARELHAKRGGSGSALVGVFRELDAKWNAIVRRVEALYPGRAIGIERDIVKRATVLALATMAAAEGEEGRGV